MFRDKLNDFYVKAYSCKHMTSLLFHVPDLHRHLIIYPGRKAQTASYNILNPMLTRLLHSSIPFVKLSQLIVRWLSLPISQT